MHQISDGERRRVQLCMGLMGHWDVLLLDEVTVDLDVLVRSELLAFLVQESEERGATIVYATHIFDGLQAFPTHICHLQLGKTPEPLLPWPLPVSQSPLKPDEQKGVMTEHSDLLGIALEWLKEDRTIRRKLEKEKGLVARGARRNEVSRDQWWASHLRDANALAFASDSRLQDVLRKVRLHRRALVSRV